MTTPYIDPQIVFASDAPTQDKPPAFNNYVKGMDETRLNEGRPTIKQFNFIQQQNDFKFLYIHERGACLPFVEGFPYENNAIVFKDGLIQQKNGSSWLIPFMRGSQNLAELTDVAQARTKLDVYSKSEALAKDNNLLELTDKAVARTNLNVYSKAETDAIALTPNASETIAGKVKLVNTLTSSATDTALTAAQGMLLNSLSFMGKTWKNVTTSRVANTTYINTNPYPIFIAISSYNTNLGNSLYLDDTFRMLGGNAGGGGGSWTISTIVLPGGSYKYTGTVNMQWLELS